MTILSFRDSSTATCQGKRSSLDHDLAEDEDDEMYEYSEITERLMLTRRSMDHDRLGLTAKSSKLPMRKSLFSYVPPFIIFRNNGTTELPAEIRKHLLWWRAKSTRRVPRLVTSVVAKSGFKITTCPSSDWSGTWCSRTASSRLKYTKLFSKVNHFPSSLELANKKSLWKNYRRMRQKYGEKNFDYMPLTFILPRERNKLWRFMRRNDGFWIVKPPNSCAGSGIRIVSCSKEIPINRSLVAQRYVAWPRLIDGIKFDIRLYVLLTSIDPLRIYVYEEGLVRLATVKYLNDVTTLRNRFMHLTNTSINKINPNYQPNDDPDACKGNMWSLTCLWKYLSAIENVDTFQIRRKIKDIVIKTILSAEPYLLNAWKKRSTSTYNFYQLFGFDIILDEIYRPWLLEVNDYPSMQPDTPLCRTVKGQLTKDQLNLVGFHVPDLLSNKELKILRALYKQTAICYNRLLYSNGVTWEDRNKQYYFSKRIGDGRREYLKSILKNLTPDDVRTLIRYEDEIIRSGRFERIFPTRDTYKYFDFFEETRYYNLLFDAWENEQADDRTKGIERLRKLCDKRYHFC